MYSKKLLGLVIVVILSACSDENAEVKKTPEVKAEKETQVELKKEAKVEKKEELKEELKKETTLVVKSEAKAETEKKAKLAAKEKVKSVDGIPDFAAIKDVKQKKKAFFDYFSVIAAQENNKISRLRSRVVLDIKNNKVDPTDAFYVELFERYKINPESKSLETHLLKKINTIPSSLLLAQAANESAWGTSRFAKLGNNYFGQWCFSKGCGLVPKQRTKGQVHEVASFKNASHSVRAYILNINRHNAYKELRNTRDALVKADKKVTGYELAKGLKRYSSRGDEYVKELRSMISYNKLQRFD